jgi:hypothetical protein
MNNLLTQADPYVGMNGIALSKVNDIYYVSLAIPSVVMLLPFFSEARNIMKNHHFCNRFNIFFKF